MSLFKCSLPEDESYDKDIEALMVPNENGIHGYPCSYIKSKPVHKLCYQESIFASSKDGQVWNN